MADRVAIVTGGNSGIGRETALQLATRGMHVFITCRTHEKGQPVIRELSDRTGNPNIECLALELGDFDSVRLCARQFLERDLPLHILVNNAGVAVQRGLTPSGFELAFGTNHLGPFLFTSLLIERILESAPGRIVFVSSRGHFDSRGIDFEAVCKKTRSQSGVKEYYDSKLANVLFSRELSRRLEDTGVTTYALHPGVVATDIWRRLPGPIGWFAKLFMLSIEEGARTSVYCATSPEVAQHSGLYYDNCRVRKASELANDNALARKLWEKSEEWVGRTFPLPENSL